MSQIRLILIEHDVDVLDSAPVKQHPYRVSPMKKELLDNEVQVRPLDAKIQTIAKFPIPTSLGPMIQLYWHSLDMTPN